MNNSENKRSFKKILVIGASGFIGGHVAQALLADGYAVRCLARNPSKVAHLAKAGCEIVQADMSNLASMNHALESIEAVYVSIHTLVSQPESTADQGFMDIELQGLQNIVAACRTNGVQRLIYVTSLGIEPDSSSVWIRERWKIEQFLLNSGLNVTVIRPGFVVGAGGRGFDTMLSQAKKSVAINFFGGGQYKMRNIALEDLIYYLVGVLNDPRAYRQCYDVGNDEIMSNNQRIDVTAGILGRGHPIKLDAPVGLLRAFAPLIERTTKMPKGSIKGVLDTNMPDAIGNPMPIRAILPRTLLDYPRALKRALTAPNAVRLETAQTAKRLEKR